MKSTEDVCIISRDTINEFVSRISMDIARRRETALCEMLGKWVSELEPCMIFRRDDSGFYDRLVGLGWIGGDKIIIPAPEGTP